MNGEEQGVHAAMTRPVTNLIKHTTLRSELPKLSWDPPGTARAQTALSSATACLESKELLFCAFFHVKKPSFFIASGLLLQEDCQIWSGNKDGNKRQPTGWNF